MDSPPFDLRDSLGYAPDPTFQPAHAFIIRCRIARCTLVPLPTHALAPSVHRWNSRFSQRRSFVPTHDPTDPVPIVTPP